MPERQPWERRKGEGSKAYAAFLRYRDLGPERSVRKAAGVALVPKAGQKGYFHWWRRWAAKWDWKARAEAWDDHVADLAASAQLESDLRIRQAQIEENERQAKTRLGVLRLGRAVVTNILQRVEVLTSGNLLDQATLKQLLPYLPKLATLLEICVKNERLELLRTPDAERDGSGARVDVSSLTDEELLERIRDLVA